MFIKDIIDYIRINRLIKKILKEENLLNNLSSVFSTDSYKVSFRQDWVGRIYSVVNPVVQSPQDRIFEYDTQGTNIKSYINKWVIEHMIAADNFVKNHQLFDILIYDLKQLDDDYNFLITLTPAGWEEFKVGLKKLATSSAIIVSVALTLIFLI